MSNIPGKRLHEEVSSSGNLVGGGYSSGPGSGSGSGSGSLKYPHDDSTVAVGGCHPSVGPKLTGNDYHHHSQSFDQFGGQQQQQQQQLPHPKIHRNEPLPNDRWSPLLPMYHHHHHHRTSIDSHLDQHPVPLENRPEFRDFKGEKDSRGGDNKELKCDRDRDRDRDRERERERDAYHLDYKGDTMRMDKEGYGAGMSHLNWKESKEHYRGSSKRYNADASRAGNLDGWDGSRSNLHGPIQEGPSIEEREYIDAHEAVGENRIELKGGEDRYKEKDRKRKDLKHRGDWGERDNKDRGERRNSNTLQLGSGSGEGKELVVKEERGEVDRWEREKKDLNKDREKSKDREKDLVKRETWNGGPEKDGLNGSDKEPAMDIFGGTPELESSTLDQKKQKDHHDGWKTAADRGEACKDRRKERDADIEPERPEKRSRCHDKESDDGGSADPEDKEREGFSYGVQQRKRILRPRGSPQVANRFRPRAQDNEGTQGKPEVSTIIYRVGECMQELMKLWKEYELSSQAEKSSESSQASPTLEIRIPAEYITATNRQVRGGQLWGTDVYTDDSDLVAVLMHTGYCRPTASPPPPAIQELRATVRVLPPQDCYISTLRNNVRSRAWGAAIGCSYRVERCCILKKGGGAIDLEPCLTHTSTVEPTLAPVAVERTMTTRAAASNALRQQRFVREVTIQYNLCNEPWIKYSLSVVADKGLKKPLYTSARLKKGEVLYLETHSRRYELCFNGEKMVKGAMLSQTQDMDMEKSQSHNLHLTNGERERVSVLKMDGDNVLIDVFRWSRCKRPLPQNLLRSSGIPLPSEHLEVLEENLDWEDIQWSQTGVFVAGKEYALARVHFMSPN